MAEIKQRISLDGAEDVANKLKKIGDTGAESFDKLERHSAKGHAGVKKFSEATEGFNGEDVAEKFRVALHTLHPVLEEAGLGLGNLGAFARVAGAGLIPLSAAIAGSLLVGLAKIGEESQRAQTRLKALGGGEGAFEGLSKQAKELGTSVQTIQPGLERLLAYRQKLAAQQKESGGLIQTPEAQEATELGTKGVEVVGGSGIVSPPTEDNLKKTYNTLFSDIRRDVGSADEAAKLADSFLQGVIDKGKISAEDIEKLRLSSPTAANRIATAESPYLGQKFSNAAELSSYLEARNKSIPSRQLFHDLPKQADQAKGDAEAARGVGEAFEGLEAATHRLAESMGGDHGLTRALDLISRGEDKAAGVVERHGYSGIEKVPLGTPIEQSPDEAARAQHALDVVRPLGALTQPYAPPAGPANTGVFREPPIAPEAPELKPEEQGAPPAWLQRLLPQPNAPGATPSPGVADFLQKALASPAELQERPRPETGPSSLQLAPPEPKAEAGNLGEDVRSGADKTVGAINDQKGILERIIEAISSALNKSTDTHVTGPVDALGVRGATGGHITGPGTGTSDSILAKLSNGEYVMKEKAVRKLGVPFLDRLNGYADGGAVDPGNASPGDSGEAHPWLKERDHWLDKHGVPFVDANGSTRKLSVAEYLSAIQQQQAGQSRADAWDKFEKGRNKWQKANQFIPGARPPEEPEGFAAGGLVGGLLGSVGSGGFDIGSMMDNLMPQTSPSSRFDSSMLESPSSSSTNGLHPVTLDFGGIGKTIGGLYAQPNAFEQLQQEAILQQAIRTVIQPSSVR